MTERNKIWDLTQESYGAISSHMRSSLGDAMKKSQLTDVPGWGAIALAWLIRPESLTVERLQVRGVYNNPSTREKSIAALKKAAYLDENAVITDKGIAEYQNFVDIQDDIMHGLDLMTEEDLSRLNDYLNRIVDSARQITEFPIGCLQDALLEPFGDNYTALHRVFLNIQYLQAFRDDVHPAAWRPIGVDGAAWEMFSMIWAGDATSAEKILEIRPGRGWTLEDWQARLDELVAKGWIEAAEEAGTFKTTDKGQKLRDEIEVKTDEYFYMAYAGLNDDEIDDLGSLLETVKTQFTREAQEA